MHLRREKKCNVCGGVLKLKRQRTYSMALLYWLLYPLAITSGGIAPAYLNEQANCTSCGKFTLQGSIGLYLFEITISLISWVLLIGVVFSFMSQNFLWVAIFIIVFIVLVLVADKFAFILHVPKKK